DYFCQVYAGCANVMF
nr:immunoglobulin light chain junction region [Macaca mulatta]MOW15075.1 immunoglobulin light chain junction region [Macaca mulatta]MOW15191.1 immunoglobulin light chain junction region [Macaca mulatta]MOW15248.1 immunoglobulin light chain junction region [Macaca mulatta]MOW15263.1 immunoglobulin light chain junction region [Macaca mulatta]